MRSYFNPAWKLSDAEIAELIDAMHNGDKGAADKLVLHAKQIFLKRADRNCYCYDDWKDLSTIAEIRLLEMLNDCTDIAEYKKCISKAYTKAYYEDYHEPVIDPAIADYSGMYQEYLQNVSI